MIWSKEAEVTHIASWNILAVNCNPLEDFPSRFLFCHEVRVHVRSTCTYKSTCTARRPRPSQLKFNNLFNEHFPGYFFFKYFVRKNWRGEGELLLKNSTIDGNASKTCYSWAGFTLRGGPGT